jgi:RNA polymerase sigma-70 factor (ECF subfamily)
MLFARIAEGDENAFARLFHEYNSKLFPFILKITKTESEAEEIIQNLFLKLWLNRHTLSGIEYPGAWMYKVAANLALSFLRSRAVQMKHERMSSWQQFNEQDEIQLKLEAKELKELIVQAVENLPPGRREIYQLSRQQGLNRIEIASRLGISESTVKNQLGSALKFIQHFIEQKQAVCLPVVLFYLH